MEDSTTRINNRLLIIVPSRGRPENAKRLLDRVVETTCSTDRVDIVFAVDLSDTSRFDYPPQNTTIVVGGNMVRALNEVAIIKHNTYGFISFMGDDVLPHSGWSERILEALDHKSNGIVYGNDLAQKEKLPTSVFMDSNIVKTLGFMAPPNQAQLYVDNFWKHLGESLDTLIYVDNAILEHLHPHVQKAESDSVYENAYSAVNELADKNAFYSYITEQFTTDLEKFK